MVTVKAQSQQITNHVVMVSPDQFGFNPQTAESNVFQHDFEDQGYSPTDVQRRARSEFDDHGSNTSGQRHNRLRTAKPRWR